MCYLMSSHGNDCYEACVGKCCIAPLQRILPPSCMDQLYSDGAAKMYSLRFFFEGMQLVKRQSSKKEYIFPHLPRNSFQFLHSKKFFTRALGIPIWQFLLCHHAPKYACRAVACNLYAWLPPRTGRVSGSTALMLCKHILCISLPSFEQR